MNNNNHERYPVKQNSCLAVSNFKIESKKGSITNLIPKIWYLRLHSSNFKKFQIQSKLGIGILHTHRLTTQLTRWGHRMWIGQKKEKKKKKSIQSEAGTKELK